MCLGKRGSYEEHLDDPKDEIEIYASQKLKKIQGQNWGESWRNPENSDYIPYFPPLEDPDDQDNFSP